MNNTSQTTAGGIMKYLLILFVTGFFFIACSSISVKTDYDQEVDFKRFKTYQWYKGKIEGEDALGRNPLVKNRVIFAVDKAMLSKKYKLLEEGEADLVLAVYAGAKERMQVTNYGGYGGRYRWRRGGWGHGGYTDVNYYDEANLIIDMFDPKEKMFVWRGVATGILNPPSDQDEQQKKIDDVVMKIINEFPPR